jgi:hypothetical protein
MSIDSAWMTGAIASKKKRCSSPLNSAMDWDSAGEVRGPLAMMAGVIWDLLHFLANELNIGMTLDPFCDKAREELPVHSQSAARGQRRGFGTFQQHGAEHRISFLSTPEARSGRLEPREFEQTSSARSWV